MRDGRVDHDAAHPPFEGEVLPVALDVLENLDEAVLEDVFCVLPAIGVANGRGEELTTETGIQSALRSRLALLAPFNQLLDFL